MNFIKLAIFKKKYIFELLKNMKTRWISMLNMLKCVMDEYKGLIMKMYFHYEKIHENLELLCDS
jgi:hypothetical protein